MSSKQPAFARALKSSSGARSKWHDRSRYHSLPLWSFLCRSLPNSQSSRSLPG
jgi:hypothetical protein